MNFFAIDFTLISCLIFFTLAFFRSCTDERNVCNGTSVCSSKEDLKKCKNSTFWNSKPISESGPGNFRCQFSGQWIDNSEANDKQMYHCHNRMDESPFTISKTENGNDKSKKKTWLEFVKTKSENEFMRRCMGSRADKDVYAMCKLLAMCQFF